MDLVKSVTELVKSGRELVKSKPPKVTGAMEKVACRADKTVAAPALVTFFGAAPAKIVPKGT